ncbi:MAG: DUF748 domain-containing protein [Gammaproteobacteria bacterium]|nr:DUF748 domain-containing protein [Gammaproteobacteria bacterium]
MLQGQGLEADIGDLEIDLDFDNTVITISKMRVRHPDGREFAVDWLYLDMVWQPFLGRMPVIKLVKIKGFRLDGLRNKKKATSFYLIADQIIWQGGIALGSNASSQSFVAMHGSLDVSHIEFVDNHNRRFVVADSVVLDQVHVQGLDKINIKQLDVTNFVLLPDPSNARSLVQLDRMRVDNFGFTDGYLLAASAIKLSGIGANILRDEDGRWELQERLGVLFPPDDKADSNEMDQSGLQVSLGVLEIMSDRPIHFTDNSLKQVFNLSTEIKEFSLSNIDSSAIEQSSPLKIRLLMDEHALFELKGGVQLFAPLLSFDLTGDINGLDLRPFNVYVEDSLGYHINSGQLNSKIKLLSIKGRLDSLLDLDFKQLTLKALDQDIAEKTDQRMGFPLTTALDLMRESDNSIQLKLPVTGDVNNPDFDASDAVFKATSSAISSVIINYYTPLGLVTITKGLFDLVTALRFDPVLFDVGSDKIAEKSVGKLAQLLSERSQLHVTLCGYSNAGDLLLLDPGYKKEPEDSESPLELDNMLKMKLLGLAEQRAESIKHHLLKKGITADRLILCEPVFKLDAIAGVDISL